MNTLYPIFEWMLGAGLRASGLVLLVFAAQWLLKNRLPSNWCYALWLPVLVALLVPAQPLLPSWLGRSAAKAADEEIPAAPATKRARPAEIAELPGHFREDAKATVAPLVPISPQISAPTLSPSLQPLNWRAWLVGVWLCGVAGAGLFVIGSFTWSLRRIRRVTQEVGSELLARILQTSQAVGLRSAPRVLQSPLVSSPAVCGFLRPTLLLNTTFPADLTDDEAEMVLRHELTHIRRGDLMMNSLLCALLALHWWNPLLWLAFSRVRVDREAACDADVLRNESAPRRAAYGHTLLKMETACAPSGICLGSVGILQRGDTLRERIQRIIAQPKPTLLMKTTTVLTIITTAILGLAKAADPDPSKSEEDAPPPKTTVRAAPTDDAKKDMKEPLASREQTPQVKNGSELTDEEREASLASRPMTPEEQKRFELINDQPELASRMMTPEEEEESGLTERFRQEEEERKKEVALHLPSFAKLQPMLAKIKDDQEPRVFEGLPHQVFYPESHASELKTKETLTREGFAFYKTPIQPTAEDAREINTLMKHPDSFSPYMAINGPGGFQPDFSLVWENNGKPIEVHVCFGNGGEIKAYHDGLVVYCQMAEIKPHLKNMLAKYHKQLLEPEE